MYRYPMHLLIFNHIEPPIWCMHITCSNNFVFLFQMDGISKNRMHDQVPQFNFNFPFDGHSDSGSNAIRTRRWYCLRRMCAQTAPTINLLLLYFAWKNRYKYTILLIANDKDFRYSLAYRRHRRAADK